MRALLFDTESTDLIKNTSIPLDRQPRVFEFFGLVVDGAGQVIEEFEFLCNPGISLPDIVTKITGVKDADLADLPRIRQWWPQLRDLVASCDRMVGHNLAYDMQVMDFEAQRMSEPLQWPIDLVCTVEATHHYKGYRLSLSNLHLHLFNEGFPDAHRARNDVMAMHRCYVELLNRGDV